MMLSTGKLSVTYDYGRPYAFIKGIWGQNFSIRFDVEFGSHINRTMSHELVRNNGFVYTINLCCRSTFSLDDYRQIFETAHFLQCRMLFTYIYNFFLYQALNVRSLCLWKASLELTFFVKSNKWSCIAIPHENMYLLSEPRCKIYRCSVIDG